MKKQNNLKGIAMIHVLKLVFYWAVYNVVCGILIESLQHLCPTFAAVHHISLLSIANIIPGLLLLWHLIHFKYVKFNRETFSEVPGKTIGLSIPFIIASMFVFNLLSEFIDLPNLMEDTFIDMSRNVFGIISLTIMAPLVEELLFRGAIEGHLLRQGKSPVAAILISALIFGILHLNPAQIPFAFAIGSIFGWLYYRTGSVVPGIVGHFLNNTFAVITMTVQTKEELNIKTIEWLGEGPAYVLFALSLAVMIGMFLYLRKKLPVAPVYCQRSIKAKNMKSLMK